ncbi:MAG: hypothetical protein OEV15_09585, partial [Gallionella sp.]|nr:hypothetical protein [Gallionella sp.]
MHRIETFLIRGAIWSLLVVLSLAGCATSVKPVASSADNALAACRALYREVDTAIERAGVRDQGSSLVPGFPYLRTTRLLASFRDELTDSQHWPAWTGHMAALDAEARALELRNLSKPVADHDSNT